MKEKNKANEGVRKSDSREANKQDPNQGYSDKPKKDKVDYPENELINEDEDLSSGSVDREPVRQVGD